MEKQEKRETKPNKSEVPERQSIIRSRNCQRNSKMHENNNNDGHQKKVMMQLNHSNSDNNANR
jgi:hypothetical protein